MLNIEADIKLYNFPIFAIYSGNVIKMEVKGKGDGGSVYLHTSDFNLMYYAIRYAEKDVMMMVKAAFAGYFRVYEKTEIKDSTSHYREQREESEADRPVSQLTRYRVLHHIASNWTQSFVKVKGRVDLATFCRPLEGLRLELVKKDFMEETSGQNAYALERLRAQKVRQEQAALLTVEPLPRHLLF
ncbi:hypothetical protein PHYBLDRAFT_148237 [Phycomyces blakesleeanus NRRL 1555(-)]|uniref:Uncharacterized protein n=1 Tax=Phycomyces blakesleeanus (strain ATCC 8743b / DSM 1359 / FGSC 10004 / NBRC 33097 / NRRL 1555) TaxID=763407 RepID=A0A163A4G9_PHYB8|nr:hypothetical protein PHYBLDRAFT_148237 [Phycomyces blakesleeanus NRRL 1555(-)]OAD71021.1 hypothetical protein PHYBLDRAFT_148237 [Phycomyces blakesleeanus NRRL 1555(-)]|eukprot:XP_018289061.1 hypothetical protein PHYBLDRAFT_148237 [Phycomyces blakesleeanus NRRL 1555(-)]